MLRAPSIAPPFTSVALLTDLGGFWEGSLGGRPAFEADSDGVTECAIEGLRCVRCEGERGSSPIEESGRGG